MTVSNGTAGTVTSKGESSMTTGAIDWLTQVRKLDKDLLEHMGVKQVQHPALGAVAAFPYRRGGESYAAKFRKATEKEWRSSQGVSRGLFNEDALQPSEAPIVITEGEIDCLSVMQAGFDRAVSLPDGWTADDGKRQVLIDEEARLRAAPYVIVAGDNDEAGAGLPKTVANILAGCDVRYATWPDGCKDANDVLMKYGEGELAKCLVEAKRIDPAGGFITGISDLPPMPARRVLRVGSTPFDYGMAFEIGAMSVGTGTPGAGKSTFTTFCAYHVAKSERVRVGIMAFETHPYKIRDHLARLHMGKPWAELNEQQQGEAASWLDRHFRIVHRRFEEGSHHLDWARQMIYTLAVRDGCKLIVLDPWNELEHMTMPGESMTAYINFALQQIRQWAEQYDTHIVVVAHPRKMMTEGRPRSPTGYDIADSAAFFNKPSLGFSVHQEENEEGEKYVTVSTWKVRDTQLYGFEKGSIRLRFHPYAMSYTAY